MLELDGRIDEAVSACRRGLTSTSEVGSIKDRMDRRQIAQTLARLLLETGEEAEEVIERLLQEGHDDFATLYLAGRLALLRSDINGALRIGLRLTTIDTDALEIGMIAYDLRLFGEFAWALLGGAYHRAGRRLEAGEAYRQAWLRAPGNMAYLAKAAALGADVAGHRTRLTQIRSDLMSGRRMDIAGLKHAAFRLAHSFKPTLVLRSFTQSASISAA